MQFKLRFFNTIVLLLVLAALSLAPAYAQAPEGQEYVVQPGDRLSEIAGRFLGDIQLYPAIVEATNARAAEDDSFTVITDPNLIEVGQKLWLPVDGEMAAPEPMDAGPAGQPDDVAGIYKAMLPGASSPGLDMTLYLNMDNSVRQVSDYLNDEPPIVEVGSWQNQNGQVTVAITGQEDGAYDSASAFLLQAGENGLTTVPEGDMAGVGRWTYLPFQALALGEQMVPYNAAKAADLIDESGLTGYYKAFLPAAACCGRDITLLLGVDDTATLQTDFLNGEPPIVEQGAWEAGDAGGVTVTLEDQDSPLSLEPADGVLKTAAEEDAYGSAGLTLYRFQVIAANSLMLTVSGSITYRETIALPPDAVIEVKLVDVSLADAPAVTISEQVITQPGQAPIPFELTYTMGDIDWQHTYAIQARILADDQLLFTTTSAYNVITQGNPDSVDLVLEQVKK